MDKNDRTRCAGVVITIVVITIVVLKLVLVQTYRSLPMPFQLDNVQRREQCYLDCKINFTKQIGVGPWKRHPRELRSEEEKSYAKVRGGKILQGTFD